MYIYAEYYSNNNAEYKRLESTESSSIIVGIISKSMIPCCHMFTALKQEEEQQQKKRGRGNFEPRREERYPGCLRGLLWATPTQQQLARSSGTQEAAKRPPHRKRPASEKRRRPRGARERGYSNNCYNGLRKEGTTTAANHRREAHNGFA